MTRQRAAPRAVAGEIMVDPSTIAGRLRFRMVLAPFILVANVVGVACSGSAANVALGPSLDGSTEGSRPHLAPDALRADLLALLGDSATELPLNLLTRSRSSVWRQGWLLVLLIDDVTRARTIAPRLLK